MLLARIYQEIFWLLILNVNICLQNKLQMNYFEEIAQSALLRFLYTMLFIIKYENLFLLFFLNFLEEYCKEQLHYQKIIQLFA